MIMSFYNIGPFLYQDDVVMGTLTVRENFMFSANVRLPSTVTKETKENKVDEVIDQLGLTHCADTKVYIRTHFYYAQLFEMINSL